MRGYALDRRAGTPSTVPNPSPSHRFATGPSLSLWERVTRGGMSQIPSPPLGIFDGREHQLPVRIYYEDTDFSGIVYHANYLRYFERGRSDFFRMIGISHTALHKADTAFAIVRMELDFKRAARIDDALLVRTTYDRVKGPRLFVSQRITRARS